MKKIKTTTWIALVVHLLLFGFIACKYIQKFGVQWYCIFIAIGPPFIAFYNNIKEFDSHEAN